MPPRALSLEIVSSSRSRNFFHRRFIRNIRNDLLESLERYPCWLRAAEAQDGNVLLLSQERYYSTEPFDNPQRRRRFLNRSQRRMRFPDNVSLIFLGRYGLPHNSNEQREIVGAVIIRIMITNHPSVSNELVYYRISFRCTDTRPRIQNTYNYLLTSWGLQNPDT
jgi:hypothetical protein